MTDVKNDLTRLELLQLLGEAVQETELLTDNLKLIRAGVAQLSDSNKVEIEVGCILRRYETYEDWVETAPPPTSMFCRKTRDLSYIVIDNAGRFCFRTSHYRRAAEDGTFPVTVYGLLDGAQMSYWE